MAREKGGFWIALCAAVFYPLTSLLAKKTIVDGHKLPRTGGVLLVMNHVSHLDPVYDAVLVHRLKRVPRFMAKDSLFEKPVAGTVLRGADQIPVYRGSTKAKDSLSAAKDALVAGKVVVIYPEGTITRDPEGWPMASRNGIARLALEADVPVIPAARWGTLDILDIYNKKFRPLPRHKVAVKFGDPLDLSQFKEGRTGNAKLTAVTELAMTKVKALLSDIRAEAAPEGFYEPKRPVDTNVESD